MQNSTKLALGKTLKWLGILSFFFSAFSFYQASLPGGYERIVWLGMAIIFFIAWPAFFFGGRGLILKALDVPLKGPGKIGLGIFAVVVVAAMLAMAITSLNAG